jgi:hypothetical protein
MFDHKKCILDLDWNLDLYRLVTIVLKLVCCWKWEMAGNYVGIQLTGLIDNGNFPHKLLPSAFNGTDLNE